MKIVEFDPNLHSANTVLSLIQDSFAFMETRIDPPSSMHKLTVPLIEDHAIKHSVLIAGDPICACAFLTYNPDHIYLGKLAVAQNKRHSGLAKALIEETAQIVEIRGLSFIELQVRIELDENHRFFKKMGFVKVAETAHDGYDRPTSYTFHRKV